MSIIFLFQQVEIATTLYDKGMLMTSHPLPTTYDEGDNDSEEEFEEDGIFSWQSSRRCSVWRVACSKDSMFVGKWKAMQLNV